MRVLIDGEPIDPDKAALSVFDLTVLRGAGVFETLRAYDGRAFEVGRHLERLDHSARALEVPLPAEQELARWIGRVASSCKNGLVRVLATPGSVDHEVKAPPRVVVMSEPLPHVPDTFRLFPILAPWHAAGAEWSLAAVKSLSYGPNVTSQKEAKGKGFDDALLLSREGVVLEAPMAAVAWVTKGALVTPDVTLGVLRSVTTAVVLDEAGALGVPHREARVTLDELFASADEVMILSTSREVRPVVAVGERPFAVGDITRRLMAAYTRRVHAQRHA